MKKFEVKKKHLTGAIADFPLHVVQAMVDEQVRQGNPADPTVFADKPDAGQLSGGFIRGNTDLGYDTWHKVIKYKQFHLIPKPEKPKGHVHAKLMKQYAKDAKTSETPWELWERKLCDSDVWQSFGTHPNWDMKTQYRRKIDSQAESKEKPTPNEIIRAMLKKDMVVWAGVSDDSYEEARDRLGRCIQRVDEYNDDAVYPVQTQFFIWKYAVPIDMTTMTEITEMPK